METNLVTLVDNLRRELDSWSVYLLVLLSFAEVFNIIYHDVLLECLSDLGVVT